MNLKNVLQYILTQHKITQQIQLNLYIYVFAIFASNSR